MAALTAMISGATALPNPPSPHLLSKRDFGNAPPVCGPGQISVGSQINQWWAISEHDEGKTVSNAAILFMDKCTLASVQAGTNTCGKYPEGWFVDCDKSGNPNEVTGGGKSYGNCQAIEPSKGTLQCEEGAPGFGDAAFDTIACCDPLPPPPPPAPTHTLVDANPAHRAGPTGADGGHIGGGPTSEATKAASGIGGVFKAAGTGV